MRTRYTSLEHFHAAKIQARQERDVHANNIGHRWMLLKQPETRGALLRDAAGDLLRSWKPYRRVHDLLNGRISGSTVSAVGMAVASMQKGFFKRLLYSGISMLLGKVIGDQPEKENGSDLLSTIATAVGGVVQRMRERKAEREQEELEEEPTSSSID